VGDSLRKIDGKRRGALERRKKLSKAVRKGNVHKKKGRGLKYLTEGKIEKTRGLRLQKGKGENLGDQKLRRGSKNPKTVKRERKRATFD